MKKFIIFLCLFFSQLAAADQIVVIVNEKNPLQSINKAQLRDYFLKKTKSWPDGTPVKFFDRREESRERNLFLNNFIERSSREVETFWIGQKLYTGHSAPTQVSTDSMVMALISRFPGAISYVEGDVLLKPGIKKIEVAQD